MTPFEPPIEIALNTSRLFMEGLHAVLELQLINRTEDEAFTVEVRLDSRLLGTPGRFQLQLDGGATRRRTLALHLPRGSDSEVGSAGDARLDIEVIIDAPGDGRHRFRGECTLVVLAHADNRQEINVNISRLIEHGGDRSGMGAINEIDLGNLIHLPESVTVNDLITQKRQPRFVTIELYYEGPVEERPSPLLSRPGDAVGRCAIDGLSPGMRLLVLTGEGIALGNDRGEADIVTWLMPRTEVNDLASRKVSAKQCRLVCTGGYLVLQHLSRVNPTRLDNRSVTESRRIKAGATHTLGLPGDQRFRVTALPMAEVDPQTLVAWKDAAGPSFRSACEWSRRVGIGGVLIRRTDTLADAEAYLWVVSMVSIGALEAAAPDATRGSPEAPHTTAAAKRIGLAALPGLHVFSVPGGEQVHVARRQVPDGLAAPLLLDDLIGPPPNLLQVGAWLQQLEFAEALSLED